MAVPVRNAAAFVNRLASLLATDEQDPEVVLADGNEYEIDENGIAHSTGEGAEAILIVRGNVEARERALSKLLALIHRR